MTGDTKAMLRGILENIARMNYIKPDDVPGIDLYMDQVTTFMDEQLASSKRYEDDKILTKTMINNYAKNNLLPPPVKKKYSKAHVLTMVFIYYFKNILSIKDIGTLLEPITGKYFDGQETLDMDDIYSEILKLQKSRIGTVAKDIARSYNGALKSFPDAPENDQDYLQLFAFICSLSFDIYVKKLLMQKLIDEFAEKQDKNRKKEKPKKQDKTEK